jgi:hypothetical protein
MIRHLVLDGRKVKRKVLVIVGIAVACLVLAVSAYPFLISRAKLESGGASPDEGIVGTVTNVDQRAMEQYCTGVVVTPLNTWLVGRREGAVETEWVGDTPDLSTLIEATSAQPVTSFSSQLRSQPETTFISRLDAQGAFNLVATLPGTACLAATPDGKRVFLLTDLDSPAPMDGYRANQSVVLQSDDQGQSWNWRKQGLFPQATVTWSMAPYFVDSQSVWVWADDPDEVDDGFQISTIPSGQFKTGLQYSQDGGATIEDIILSEALLVEVNAILDRVEGPVQWSDMVGRFGEVKGHIAQLDAQRAVLWVTQDFAYAQPGSRYITDHMYVTSHAVLNRKDGRWHADKVQRLDDFAIERVLDNGSGKIVALAYTGHEPRMSVFVLDAELLEWKKQGSLPGAFGPIESHTGLREAFIGEQILVLNVMSSHEVPSWLARLTGEEEASISADAVFYSKDWGRSWKRLAIPGYLGVLGMDARNNKVIWAKGNWYDSQDLNVRSYGLK